MAGLIEWGVGLIIGIIAFVSYPGIVLLMALESACMPVPSEIVMPFGGYLAYTGELNIWLVGMAGTVGCLLGSWLAYFVGLHFGRSIVLKYGKYLLFSKKHLEKTEEFFESRGEMTVFLARLLPVVRTFISLPAGIARMDFKKFTIYTFLGCLPWCYGLAFVGYWLGPVIGDDPGHLLSKFHGLDIVIVIAVIVFFIWYVWIIRKEDDN